MTTIGDVLMIFGGIVLASFALWGLMVLSAVIFPKRSLAIAQRIETSIGKSIWTGVGVFVPALMLILIFANLPSPATKVISLLLALIVLLAAAVGAGGLVTWTSQRLGASSGFSQYGSLTRASMLWVTALNVPFFGWFLVGSIVLILGLGSFTLSLGAKAASPVSEMSGGH